MEQDRSVLGERLGFMPVLHAIPAITATIIRSDAHRLSRAIIQRTQASPVRTGAHHAISRDILQAMSLIMTW